MHDYQDQVMDDSHTALLHNSGRSTMKQQSSDDNYMLDSHQWN